MAKFKEPDTPISLDAATDHHSKHEIFSLGLTESMYCSNTNTEYLRVPNGFVVSKLNFMGDEIVTSCFVPYEFESQ